MAALQPKSGAQNNGVGAVLRDDEQMNAIKTQYGQAYSNDLGKLAWGAPDEREKFVERYGYKHALEMIDDMAGPEGIKPSSKSKEDLKMHKEWLDDIMQYKADLLGRQAF